jgi:uncharacterized lipoprotein NlpE involved in copper resistance
MKRYTVTVTLIVVYLLAGCNTVVESGKIRIKNCSDCLVENEETAVRVAEAILFERYGQNKIEDEKPYTVEVKSDSIWVLDGALNQIGYGGTFHIEISSKNGKIIEVTHYK